MKVNTLFSNVSHINNHDLYSFVVERSRESRSEIKIKASSHGIVEDLCEIVDSMYGMKVVSLVVACTNSWVLVSDHTGGIDAFLDMNWLPSGSTEHMGLSRYFNQDPTFVQCFPDVSPAFTSLIQCFENKWALPGINSNSTEGGVDMAALGQFPWTLSLNLNKSQSVLHTLLDALCAYTYAVPISHLITIAHRIFVVRDTKMIALINFESNEDLWLEFGSLVSSLSLEDKFNKMLACAQDCGKATTEIIRRLHFYFAKLVMETSTNGHILIEPYECYTWCTHFAYTQKASLVITASKEHQHQESRSVLLKTKAGTTLPIIWDENMQMWRGFLITADTHPLFGSVSRLRTFVEKNIKELLKTTAAAASDTHELLKILQLWEKISKYVVDSMHMYIERCSWMAYHVLVKIIDMYDGKFQQIDLHTFLAMVLHNYTGVYRKISGEIALLEESDVFFLTMPTQPQSLSANAFNAMKAADPVKTASGIFINAFHDFLAHADASNGVHDEALDESEPIDVPTPQYVKDADKETLYILLQSRSLQHLLAITPFIPGDKLWLGAVIRQGCFHDIFSLASKAMLLGMTRELVVFQFEGKLFVTHITESSGGAAGYMLITEVVNAYNMLASGSLPSVANIIYNVHDVVMLFRSFNIGYKKNTSEHQMVDPTLLCEAMTHVLLGGNPRDAYHMRAVWAHVVNFSLGGSISHRARVDFQNNTNMECLNTMLVATEALHRNKVQINDVVPGSIYFIEQYDRSTFIVAPPLLERNEDIIRNVQLQDVCTDAATIGVLASLIIKSLGLHGHETCKVTNAVKINRALCSRYQLPTPIPFIVRQLLQVLWNAYQDHMYFPDVESDNGKLISTWEKNVADESMPFHIKVINLVLIGDLPKESALIQLDNTVAVIVQNGIGSKEETTCSMTVTDWPLIRNWGTYVTLMETLRSALNVYKDKCSSRQVSSLLRFGQTLDKLWTNVEQKKSAMRALLPKNLTISLLDSVRNIVEQLTKSAGSTAHAVLKVFDKVMSDDTVSVVTNEGVCMMQLLEGNQATSVITIYDYPFALLDKSIALQFHTTSRQVRLEKPIDNELIDITKTLMGTYDNVQNGKIIQNGHMAKWLLACMPMLPIEKQRRVSHLCLSGLLDDVHLFLNHNPDLLQTSMIEAVNCLVPGKVTKEVYRKFLRDVFVPFMDNINRDLNVGACLLLDPSSSADYYILCTKNKTNVGLLCKGMEKPEALIEWVKSTQVLIGTQASSPLHVFVEKIRKNGPSPVLGEATKQLLATIPSCIEGKQSSQGLIDTITRASVLNAWTRDIPALEIYTRNYLVKAGCMLATTPII